MLLKTKEELYNRALHELEAGNYDVTIEIVDKLINEMACFADAHVVELKFLAYYRKRDWEKALEILEDFEKWYPIASLYAAKSSVFNELDKMEEAVDAARKALKLDKNNPHGWLNLGVAYMKVDDFPRAIRAMKEALKLDPAIPEAINNLAVLYGDLRQNEKSLEYFEKGLSIAAEKSSPLMNWEHVFGWNKATLLLRMGNFEEGFRLYENRNKIKNLYVRTDGPPYTVPMWDHDRPLMELSGRTLLVSNEQGIGDFVQFSRYVKPLIAMGVKVILEVEPHIVPLAECIDGVTAVTHKDPTVSPDLRPPHDFWYSIMSLPYLFKTKIDTIPEQTKLEIKERADKVMKWKYLLRQKTKPRIGIAWSGRQEFKQDFRRSIAFKEFMHALPEGPEYIILQKEIRPSDTELVKTRKDLHFYGHHLDDLVDTAELIDNLDLVVCVDTGVGHIAATMGKETWVMVHYASDWRWFMNDRKTSPWYPSLKLYRQTTLPGESGAWRKLIPSVRNDIRKKFSL